MNINTIKKIKKELQKIKQNPERPRGLFTVVDFAEASGNSVKYSGLIVRDMIIKGTIEYVCKVDVLNVIGFRRRMIAYKFKWGKKWIIILKKFKIN